MALRTRMDQTASLEIGESFGNIPSKLGINLSTFSCQNFNDQPARFLSMHRIIIHSSLAPSRPLFLLSVLVNNRANQPASSMARAYSQGVRKPAFPSDAKIGTLLFFFFFLSVNSSSFVCSPACQYPHLAAAHGMFWRFLGQYLGRSSLSSFLCITCDFRDKSEGWGVT